jgi:hypothetical protein
VDEGSLRECKFVNPICQNFSNRIDETIWTLLIASTYDFFLDIRRAEFSIPNII